MVVLFIGLNRDVSVFSAVIVSRTKRLMGLARWTTSVVNLMCMCVYDFVGISVIGFTGRVFIVACDLRFFSLCLVNIKVFSLSCTY